MRGVGRVGCLVALLAGCGSADDGRAGTASDPATDSAGGGPAADLASAAPTSTTAEVTHRWFPLEPRTRWTYREVTEDGEEVEVVVTVTSATKETAAGLTGRVVRDTVTEDGVIVEDTLDWYGQAPDGTVWYLGEDTAEFEDGELSTREGSFEAGVDGAEAGVIMPAEPAVGQQYRQEYLEGVAEDRGRVLALGESAEVPAGSYDGLLMTADTNDLEPGVVEHKYYARDVGLVLTVDLESDGREELLGVTRVSAAEARRAGEALLGEAY